MWLLAGCWTAFAQVDRATEEALTAAFLYNFVKFVDWPAEAFAEEEDPLVVCLEDGPVADVLEETIHGKTAHSRELVVYRWMKEEPFDRCNLLFVSDLSRETRARIIRESKGRSVLTVGDMKHFAEEGGVINLIKVRDRLRFEVNPAAADRANLRISSKLMRLAQVVPDRAGERLE